MSLADNLPGIRKAAIIGGGGGRDVLSAHLYGVPEIVGVELNSIFVDPAYQGSDLPSNDPTQPTAAVDCSLEEPQQGTHLAATALALFKHPRFIASKSSTDGKLESLKELEHERPDGP